MTQETSSDTNFSCGEASMERRQSSSSGCLLWALYSYFERLILILILSKDSNVRLQWVTCLGSVQRRLSSCENLSTIFIRAHAWYHYPEIRRSTARQQRPSTLRKTLSLGYTAFNFSRAYRSMPFMLLQCYRLLGRAKSLFLRGEIRISEFKSLWKCNCSIWGRWDRLATASVRRGPDRHQRQVRSSRRDSPPVQRE